jgi:polysaccharide export outer membrane protein
MQSVPGITDINYGTFIMNSHRSHFAWFLFVLALAASCARAQERQPEYQIGNGDNIRIQVFQNPDLTIETRVTENGTISYPLVGTVRVGGLTIPAAEQAIAKALSDGGFIQKPQVNIVLLANRGNQVTVLGLVGRPGRYPLETFNTRLSEMMAIAGGITPGGGEIVIVTGTRDGKPFRKEVDLANMYLTNDFRDDIVVAGGDVLYVYRQPMYYIYGEVQRAGAYRIERGMTIRQALATGGGPTLRGTERRLRVHRRSADGAIQIIRPDLNDPVLTDDVLYVTESLF